VIDSTYVVENTATKQFEKMVRDYTNSRHAVSMTNGTVGLYCCLKALGIGNGDEVIVPDMTFVATANAVIMAGGTPVFVDVVSSNFCISPEEIVKNITPRTKAIIPVHLYGQAANMDAIMEIAKQHQLHVIEDAAQSIGVLYNKKHTGTIGDCGVFSFYSNKTITTGEGGIITTQNDVLRDKCYRLKNHGRSVKGIFVHDEIGFNFSFTEMQAALGISQMRKLPAVIAKKQRIYDLYRDRLSCIDNKMIPIPIATGVSPVHWFTSFLTQDKESLMDFMKKRGVQTRLFFYPLHMQPCYANTPYHQGEYPNSKQAYDMGISLPSSYGLSESDQHRVIDTILEFYL